MMRGKFPQTRIMGIFGILRIVIGIVLFLFGFIGIVVGIIGLIDPVGSKMADDSDPFGTPPSFLESLLMTVVYFAIAGSGILLIWYKRKT
jgi:hypothetical protein